MLYRLVSPFLAHAGLEIDEALREFLELVWLHGESQKIQRILSSFADHFYVQTPSVFLDQDAATTMSFAVIMLNTNLHHPKVFLLALVFASHLTTVMSDMLNYLARVIVRQIRYMHASSFVLLSLPNFSPGPQIVKSDVEIWQNHSFSTHHQESFYKGLWPFQRMDSDVSLILNRAYQCNLVNA